MKYHFDIKDLLPIGVTFVVVTITLAFGLQILGEQKDEFGDDRCTGYWNTTSDSCHVSKTNSTALSYDSTTVNATTEGMSGLAKFPEKLPLIATVVVAVVIIGILVKYFKK